MNIIARNALSPWSSGFQHKGMTFRPATLRGGLPTIRMGQAALTESVRNQTITVLNDAWNKAAAMDAYRAANPDWKQSMGADGDQFVTFSGTAAPLLAAATKVRQTLQGGTDPATWIVTSQELTDAQTWASTINGMWGLMTKHSSSLQVPSPGTGIPPGGTTTTGTPPAATDYTIPIAIGAGVLLLGGLLYWKSQAKAQ